MVTTICGKQRNINTCVHCPADQCGHHHFWKTQKHQHMCLLPCGSMWSPPVLENKETSTHAAIALRINVVTTSYGQQKRMNACVCCCRSMWSPPVVENKETSTHVFVALQISPRWWSMRRGEAMVSLGKASPHHCSSCRNLKIEKAS